MAKIREERLNEEMKKTVSAILFDLKDPRVGGLTSVTKVEVTNDLKYAKVYVSVYDGDAEKRREALDALNHAAGFVAHEVGQRMQIRCIPRFRFVADESIAYGAHIADILNKLHLSETDNTPSDGGEA